MHTEKYRIFLARRIADGFGSGQLSPAPGTWGSAVAAVLLWALAPAPAILAATLLVSFPLAYVCVAWVMDLDGEHDPGWIVIDEWQGIGIAWLLALPQSAGEALLVFGLFRLFDIWKPSPIRDIDRELPGALGVLVDDWVAGLAAGLVFLTGTLQF